ncbi:hypothetical protein E4U61_006596 [Claviceps capensis]|nr:hypothetical protein E4U61_006596 [Claviceps capensis]
MMTQAAIDWAQQRQQDTANRSRRPAERFQASKSATWPGPQLTFEDEDPALAEYTVEEILTAKRTPRVGEQKKCLGEVDGLHDTNVGTFEVDTEATLAIHKVSKG